MVTSHFSVKSKFFLKINPSKIILKAVSVLFPNMVKNRCTAILFALKRNVMGLIILLIFSISTIKGRKTLEVLCGIKWENMCLVWLSHPNSKKNTQRGILIVRVSPINIIFKIKIKSLRNIIVLPVKRLETNRFLNS